ncbi:MAG: 23S rRNA (adenine(2030)-N(6))-methyltransferase RlmJ [Rickettsiales bacterium]|nr:23S rRNA (adenine(2030)-N(6))-methyltransferase RlmJ [Rickettsiales bacterium]
MNYHHIYHAGNFADIFKHVILCLALEKFHEKPSPFFVLDTHAGIGKYDLSDEKSLKTFEAEAGIKKLLSDNIDFLPPRYLKILAKINRCEISELADKFKFYPGSPFIIQDYLRSQDKAIFAELNRDDFAQLKRNFAGNKKFSITKEDGFHLLSSKLPPLEKRGLVIIDPAFEKDQSSISADYEKIINALKQGYKRFSHGVYLVWYPIINKDLEKKVLEKFYQEIGKLSFEKKLHVTFNLGKKPEEEEKMNACGMFIFNAPWQLDEKMKMILPEVLQILKKSDEAKFEMI